MPFLKAIKIFFCILAYALGSMFILTFTQDPDQKRKKIARHMQYWCAHILRAIGLKLTILNKPANLDKKNVLVIGNHMGFVDIFILTQGLPCNFVTSIEMGNTFGLGMITRLGSCIYVERRNRDNIKKEKQNLVEALRHGNNVVLYPEGTSSNGEQVLPFRRTLMTAAADAERPLQLVCTNFLKVNGEPFSLKHRDALCWYEDLSLYAHLRQLLALRSVEAELIFISQLHPKPEDNKDWLASHTRDLVASHFKPVKNI